MTPASVAATFASDLYPPGALEAPPCDDLEALPPQWVSYQDFKPPALPLAAAQGAFDAFRRTDDFTRVHQQILARVEDCQAWARTQLTRQASAKVEGDLAAFRLNLSESLHGPGGLFTPVDVQHLFDGGKRDLDAACLKLADGAIDLHLRKQAFMTMTEAMATCQGAGVAYERALTLLRQREGGLPGTFYRHVQQMSTAAIQAHVRQEMPVQADAHNEVHYVEWFRHALGIGGDVHDRVASNPRLVSAARLEACRQHLRKEVPPLRVAQRMAEAYLGEVREAVLAERGQPQEVFDSSDSAQWQCLRRAMNGLVAAYGVVDDRSVLQFDIDTSECRIRTDPSLVARDLLVSLRRLGRVNLSENRVVLSETRQGAAWQLLHVDEQLFFEVQKAPHGPAEIDSMSLSTLRRIAPGTLRQAAVNSVLGAQSPADLMSLPASDLTTLEQAAHLLRRLGPERSAGWAEGQVLEDATLSLLILAATEGGHLALLRHVVDRGTWGANVLLALGGGRSILEKSWAHGQAEGVQFWLKLLERAARDWSQRQFETFFAPVGEHALLDKALARGRADVVDAILGILFEARRRGRIDEEDLVPQVTPPPFVDEVGRLAEHFHSLGGRLAEAAARKDLGADALRRVIEWEQPAVLWRRVLEKNDVRGLRWYHGLVVQCAPFLTRAQVEAMLTSPVYSWLGSQFEALTPSPEALEVRMKMLVEDVLANRISTQAVWKMLTDTTAEDADWRWAYWFHEEGHHASILMDGVLELFRQRRLSGMDVKHLLASEKKMLTDWRTRSTLLHLSDGDRAILDRYQIQWLPPEARLKHWLAAVIRAEAAGAVNGEDIRSLLSGEPAAGPPLFRAMGCARSYIGPEALINAVLELRRRDLIDADVLERLLKGKHRRSGAYALTQACALGHETHVRTFIEAVARAVEERLLTRAGMVRLIEGRGHAGRAVGCFQTTFDGGNASMAKTLFECTLSLLGKGLLMPDEWVDMILNGCRGNAFLARTSLPRGSGVAAQLEAAITSTEAARHLRPEHIARLRAFIPS